MMQLLARQRSDRTEGLTSTVSRGHPSCNSARPALAPMYPFARSDLAVTIVALGAFALACASPFAGRAAAARSRPAGYCFAAEGLLCVTNFATGTPHSSCTYQFSVSVSNGLWNLRSKDDYLSSAPGARRWREVAAGTDGEDVYAVVELTGPQRTQEEITRDLQARGRDPGLARVFKPVPNGLRKGYVTPGSMPHFDENLRIVWFALLSSDYLDRHGATNLLPFWSLAEPTASNYYTADFVRAEMVPRLPEAVSFLSGGNQGLSRALQSAYGNPVVAGAYRVAEWTNYGGWTIPLHFEFTQFGGHSGSATRYCRGRIAKLSGSRGVQALPTASAGLDVTDYRFPGKGLGTGGFRYSLPAAHWEKAGSPALASRWAERGATRSVRISRQEVGRRRLVATLVIITIAGVPPLVLWWRFRRNRAKTNL